MSGAVYGGDEVGAIVVDIGSHLSKVGFAGEDTPKAVFPTHVGWVQSAADSMDTGAEGQRKANSVVVGTPSLHCSRHNMEMKHPLVDGLIEDWDLYEELLNYSFSTVLHVDPANHPMMISEATWNTPAKREKLAEILFEKFKVPALYLCKDAVLTAFASGRSTALVVSSGAGFTSAVPVYDGFVLYQGLKRSDIAGNLLTKQYRKMLEERKKIEIIPSYLVASKMVVGEGEPARYVKKANIAVTKSFQDYMVDEVVRDFQIGVSRMATPSYNESVLKALPTSHYEFPNGYNDSFGIERYQIPELLFNPDSMAALGVLDGAPAEPAAAAAAPNPALTMKGVQHLITSSIHACDIDVHQNLWSSVILSGGNTLVSGYSERLMADLARLVPTGTKYKVIAPISTHERVFSSWIGGSILASLGSFQQMWLSRAEYDELGKGIVEKKCP